jgi:hypothetical protein
VEIVCGDIDGDVFIYENIDDDRYELIWKSRINNSYAKSMTYGDFDGDGDLDFITPGISQQFIVFIKNEGNLNFSHQLIPVDDFVQALTSLDYDNDGDLDFVTANYSERNGITLFLNDDQQTFILQKAVSRI